MHSEMTCADEFIDRIAKPIMDSESFHRLHDVTFLGILSPRFTLRLPDHPLFSKIDRGLKPVDDGSRANHSLSVAKLAVEFCNAFSLSNSTKKYAVVWALTHDIATWPLSHTGEAAFTSITGTTHKLLRHKMVTGSPEIPRKLRTSEQIRAIGLDPDRLTLLFRKKNLPPDEEFKELRVLHSLIHSAITPDSLEGIHRAGQSVGAQVPDPSTVLNSFDRNMHLFNVAIVRKKSSGPILKFWREKQKIYETYINTPRTMAFESQCSEAIRNAFGSVSLVESLELTEKDVVEAVSCAALPPFESIVRYKAPQKYFLDSSLKHKRVFRGDYPIGELNNLLIRG